MSSGSYEDYEREYKSILARIRSYLAGTRNRSTLTECERLLQDARRCAIAMTGIAEVEGGGAGSLRLTEANNCLQRDIAPLQKEVERALNEMGRQELFFTSNNNYNNATAGSAHAGYHAPDLEHGGSSSQQHQMMESLIQSSDDLLRDSHAILNETEYIGTHTIHQMGQQREQIQSANEHVQAVRQIALQAKQILSSMSRRAWKSKLCLYALITLLAVANAYVLVCIYKKHSK